MYIDNIFVNDIDMFPGIYDIDILPGIYDRPLF